MSDVNVLTINIPKGYGRFGHCVNTDGKFGLIVSVSDTQSEERGVGVELPTDEICTPVLFIPLEDAIQAEVWSEAFRIAANWMKEDAEGERDALNGAAYRRRNDDGTRDGTP